MYGSTGILGAEVAPLSCWLRWSKRMVFVTAVAILSRQLVRVVCAIRFGEGTRASSKVVHFRNTEENGRFGVFVNTPHSSPLSSAPWP